MALLRLAIATYDVTIIATSRPCRNVFRRDNLRFEGDFPVASRCVPPEHIVPGTVILPARRFTTVWYLQILLCQAERISQKLLDHFSWRCIVVTCPLSVM